MYERKMDSEARTLEYGKMMEGCQEIMDRQKQLVSEMKAQDAELTAHAAKMNAASGEQKMNEMASLLTHVVKNKAAMGARMAALEEDKMQHMMKHMGMGKDTMGDWSTMKDTYTMEKKEDMEALKNK